MSKRKSSLISLYIYIYLFGTPNFVYLYHFSFFFFFRLISLSTFWSSLFLYFNAVKVLHSICQQIWETQQWSQDWKRSVFIPVPKRNSTKECSNYGTVSLISHTSKVMLKILQARLQRYVNWELQMFKLDLEKPEEPEIKLPTSIGS